MPCIDGDTAPPTTSSRPLSLAVERRLPTHAFPDEFIECTLRLHHGDDLGLPVSFQVALVHADTKLTEESTSQLVVDSSTPLVFVGATCTFRFSLTRVMQKMCLRCSLVDPHPIVSVLTSAISIVREKLVVTQQPPDVWFKDEGGRDKCMTIQVNVEAAPGRTVSPRIIPLELTLLYDSGDVVQASAVATSPSHGILKLFPDLRPNVTNGTVSISFRIEDVSKNHQNHAFVLKIAPESSDVYADIASVRTAPVAIRSKRNKRRLAGLKSPSNNTNLASEPSPSAASSGSHRPRMLPTPVPHHSATPTTTDKTPMSRRFNSSTATPHNLPRARPSTWTDAMQEWKLVGYEIHEGDGSINKQAPIYRCLSCASLTDMSPQNTTRHAPSCMYLQLPQQHQSNFPANTPRQQHHPVTQATTAARMVYGYNTHGNYTPSASQTSMAAAATAGPGYAGTTPTNYSTTPTPHSSLKHSDNNIFLSTKAAATTSSSPAMMTDAMAKPMLMMDMYMSANHTHNNNWQMMHQQVGTSSSTTPTNEASGNHGTTLGYPNNSNAQPPCVAFILASMATDMRVLHIYIYTRLWIYMYVVLC
ncbi:hypothetical protein, variant 1 [Aphanomyces astaci]|uniref:Uncharacterized protein n=1 Tax=Aphanomyces astaci TaxID=112090 RepID=W4FTF6_APHAT|nr:hypothetical protein, variant 1 [Aphanomyces astaci]ETV69943.1 hypothetical protein, variant 1 [Aphanomyces astaci]|eukprot:XP_009840680.1 hypothetical protein, variant 1 [Aphanomyces astaci]